MTTSALLRVGARGSILSVTQTGLVRADLAAALGADIAALPFSPITTSGDRQQEGRLIEAGGKGLFTKELDEALLDGRIDLAVHSLKDLPTRLPDGIVLACVPKREDPRDAFISKAATTLPELPAGAVLGTASLRRQAQALHARPDLLVKTLRGNVETRLAKINSGAFDATFLALSGLKRLGLAQHAASLVDPDRMPPAACQGALAITARADDARALAMIAKLEDAATRFEIEAERGFLLALDGSCRTPIAALARRLDKTLSFIGETLTADGLRRWRRVETRAIASIAGARAFGEALGQSIKDEAGDALLIEP